MGVIAFCPLAQGMLTNKYLGGVPKDSRAGTPGTFLKAEQITPELKSKLQKLNEIANARGQSIAQLALAWVLRSPAVTTALIGASRPQQIVENVKAAEKLAFTKEELAAIDAGAQGVV